MSTIALHRSPLVYSNCSDFRISRLSWNSGTISHKHTTDELVEAFNDVKPLFTTELLTSGQVDYLLAVEAGKWMPFSAAAEARSATI